MFLFIFDIVFFSLKNTRGGVCFWATDVPQESNQQNSLLVFCQHYVILDNCEDSPSQIKVKVNWYWHLLIKMAPLEIVL